MTNENFIDHVSKIHVAPVKIYEHSDTVFAPNIVYAIYINKLQPISTLNDKMVSIQLCLKNTKP